MPRASPSGGTPSWQRYASVASFPECMRPIDPPDSAPQGMPILLARQFGTWQLSRVWGLGAGGACQMLNLTCLQVPNKRLRGLPVLISDKNRVYRHAVRRNSACRRTPPTRTCTHHVACRMFPACSVVCLLSFLYFMACVGALSLAFQNRQFWRFSESEAGDL